jgi:ankyrin repeat protein
VCGEIISCHMGHKLVVPHFTCVILCTHLVWSPAPPMQSGRTPLWTACKKGHAASVKLLLEAKADPNKGSNGDVRGLEPIVMLCIYSCTHLPTHTGVNM